MKNRTYIAIDLKSFYASVECRERGLDPLDTNLVVADESRTDKTICLAVTPSLKSYGISGRGRLFEVKQRVKEANAGRQHDAPGHKLEGSSCYNIIRTYSAPKTCILAEFLCRRIWRFILRETQFSKSSLADSPVLCYYSETHSDVI